MAKVDLVVVAKGFVVGEGSGGGGFGGCASVVVANDESTSDGFSTIRLMARPRTRKVVHGTPTTTTRRRRDDDDESTMTTTKTTTMTRNSTE